MKSEDIIIEKMIEDNIVIIRISGRIEEKYIASVKKALQIVENSNSKEIASRIEAYPLVIDMSEVSYLDSAMLGALVDAMYKHEEAGVGFYIGGINDEVRTILELLQLHKVILIFPDCESAKAHIARKITKICAVDSIQDDKSIQLR